MSSANSSIRLRKEKSVKKPEGNERKQLLGSLTRMKKSWIGRIQLIGHFLANQTLQRSVIIIACAVILALILSPTFKVSPKEYVVGDIALKDIRSTRDLLVEDEASTEKRRRDAIDTVRSVYDYDPSVLEDAEKTVVEAFALFENLFATNAEPSESTEDKRQRIEEKLGIKLRPTQWEILGKQFDSSLSEEILSLVRPLLKKGVVSDRRFLDQDQKKGITIRDIVTHEERKEDIVLTVADVDIARRSIKRSSEGLIKTRGRTIFYLVNEAAGSMIRPNLTFNRLETEDRKTAALESVEPVYFSIKKGEMLVREGDPIQADDLIKLRALEALQTRVSTPMTVTGWVLIVALVLLVLYDFATKNVRKIAPTNNDLLFVALLIVGTGLLLRVSISVTGSLENGFHNIPATWYFYLFPVAAGAMLVRIVLNSEMALVFSVIVSYLAGLLLDNSIFFFVYTFIASV
ncbi:MAG: hypothetical protein GTN74_02415, partial [Proteobacteria bacterium]|nr:hypothetical protein [Pseudomonadota bacterium]NIS68017.1 hypothetical protein [Pseudomonadota bacterium]